MDNFFDMDLEGMFADDFWRLLKFDPPFNQLFQPIPPGVVNIPPVWSDAERTYHENCRCEPVDIVPEYKEIFVKRIIDVSAMMEDEFFLYGLRVLIRDFVPANTIWVIVPPAGDRPFDKPALRIIKVVEVVDGG